MDNEMKGKKNRNRLDQLIRMDFREAQNWIGCGAIISLFSAIIGIAAQLGLCKKLFYTGIFGEGEALYESLPVTPRELAISKIYVATAGITIMNLVSVIAAFLVSQIFAGGATIGQKLSIVIRTKAPDSLAATELPLYMALDAIDFVVSAMSLSVLVFAGIVWYCTREENKKGLAVKIADVIVVFGLWQIVNLPVGFTALENINAFLPVVMIIVVKLSAVVLLIPWILKKIDGRQDISDRGDQA